MEDSQILRCPECGGEMSFQGYRPLFPECLDCGETSFIGKCIFPREEKNKTY